jgi:hypothetical protein
MTGKNYYTSNLDDFFDAMLVNGEMRFELQSRDYELNMNGTGDPGSPRVWYINDPATGKTLTKEYPNVFELAAAPVWGGMTLLEAWPEIKPYE